jgi:hypothetical protein
LANGASWIENLEQFWRGIVGRPHSDPAVLDFLFRAGDGLALVVVFWFPKGIFAVESADHRSAELAMADSEAEAISCGVRNWIIDEVEKGVTREVVGAVFCAREYKLPDFSGIGGILGVKP